jgi:molybdenum cofactor cytidylyltransferase
VKPTNVKKNLFLLKIITDMSFGVLVLAAGFSQRMGKDKFLLKYNDNQTFLDKIIESYDNELINKIVVVINLNSEKHISSKISSKNKVKIVINNQPELGRFNSIKLGIQYFSSKQSVFLHNSDNPFAEKEVINKLIENNSENSYCVPTFQNKGGHPILISGKIIFDLKNEKDININLKDFLKSYNCKRIEVSCEKILLNINTENEYLTEFEKWKNQNIK